MNIATIDEKLKIKEEYKLLFILNEVITGCVFPLENTIKHFFNSSNFVKTIDYHAKEVRAKYWCVGGCYVSVLLGRMLGPYEYDIFFLQCESPRSINMSIYMPQIRHISIKLNYVYIPKLDELPDSVHFAVFNLLNGIGSSILMNAIYYKDQRWYSMIFSDDSGISSHTQTYKHKFKKNKRNYSVYNPSLLKELAARCIFQPLQTHVLNALNRPNKTNIVLRNHLT